MEDVDVSLKVEMWKALLQVLFEDRTMLNVHCLDKKNSTIVIQKLNGVVDVDANPVFMDVRIVLNLGIQEVQAVKNYICEREVGKNALLELTKCRSQIVLQYLSVKGGLHCRPCIHRDHMVDVLKNIGSKYFLMA